ncbi:MAG: CHAT domain-containing protein [Gammaproteobacteria bacterium]|jgi:CHAT domain-containing protein/Flp pilus assembly protein TadD|nr:CHAT domain-containing protein [Gammaproteobacteria bacterium]MBT5441469.1 CHAT domain-containing protein [Gammaproteobacteria bacterium]MBT5791954.1 CHAT domain-containing protein [Gammaproteobacteria bacterium]MBT6950387.1 CHAT domain-containing protein [Gammaproteobacteria bacterium]MBT7531580.1 CHAT domain-containing protein [Gammaproteobacteria bacterium]
MFRKIAAISLMCVITNAYGSDLRVAAEEALMTGDIELALESYVELLAEFPDDQESLEIAVMLAEELGAAELALQLLVVDVERSVELKEIHRTQSSLRLISEVNNQLPAWVDETLAVASAVTEDQLADFEAWQELTAEAQALLESGDFEDALMLFEGALMLAVEVFGPDHWLAVASTRESGLAARQLGDAATADAFYSDAYATSSELLGEAHPQTQYIAGLMAELFNASQAFEEAKAMKEFITANYESEIGVAHSLTMASRLSEVDTLTDAADNSRAEELLSLVCSVYTQNYSAYHPETLECQSRLAKLNRNTGSLDEAEKILVATARNLAESTKGISEFAIRIQVDLADIYWERGEYQASKDKLSGLILTARQIGATDLSFIGKNYLARVLASEGELDSAQLVSEDVVGYGELAWRESPVQYYNALLELGAVYQRKSRFEDAERIFEETMLAMLEIGGEYHPTTLVAMNNLGNIYEQLGFYDDAEPVLEQTLDGMEVAMGLSHPQTARTRNNLALLHESQGNFREAEPLYETSYEHISELLGQNHPDAMGMQNNLAYLYMMMEEYETAAAMFEDLVERWSISLGADHQDALKGRNNLGRVYQKLGRLDEAQQQVTAALATRKMSLGERHIDTIRSMIDLGSIYLDQGRLDDARKELTEALEIAEQEIGEQHPYTFEALNNLARVEEAAGKFSVAVELREKGLARRSVFLDRMLWVTGENAREGYIRLHRPELDDYLSLLALITDPIRGKKAIEASLQRKGLLLKITSEIEQVAQLSTDPRLASISAELERARRTLASLTLSGPTADTQGRHAAALYELELRVNDLQGELGRASVRYRSSIAGTNADALADSLPEDTALVDIMMYSEGDEPRVLAGVIVNQGGEISYDLVEFSDRGAMEESVIEYRTIIQDDLADDDEIIEAGQLAYELVWAPIRESTGELEYVYLIPDGVLNILPFNALMNDDEQYLIQTTDVHILTSGRDLLPNDDKLSLGAYVILAGPDYNSDQIVGAEELQIAAGRRSAAMKLGIRGAGGGLRGLNFAPLPGAEKEGRTITDRLVANDHVNDVYFGDQAQERVLAEITESPEILHLATHGFFLEADDTLRKRLLKMQRSSEIQVPPPGDNPLLRAGLAFAGINSNAQFLGDIDTVNDGVLTALEVLGLNLSGTKLVVLSACETGLGEIHEGEGVYGLRRSFQEAGVAEVISSLWEVSDGGTQALMTDFYDRLLDGSPAREALRDTQIAMIDSPEWGYPYIWSAFMIVGSYESAGITIQ